MNIEGKNIVITGASSGIGLEIVHLLEKYSNVKIIAIARHIDSIPQSPKIIPFAADVSSKEGIDRVYNFASKIFAQVDIFIANAGFAYLERLSSPDWNHIENIYDLNVFSPIYSLEKLISQNGNSKRAFICTVSGAGLASLPAYSLYCSTKAALNHFFDTYRYEKPQNLQLTAIYPVATRTEFFDKATNQNNTPLPFPQQDAKTVAKKIVNGIIKGKKRVYPSLLFKIFYPLGRAFPYLLHIYSLLEKRKVKEWLS